MEPVDSGNEEDNTPDSQNGWKSSLEGDWSLLLVLVLKKRTRTNNNDDGSENRTRATLVGSWETSASRHCATPAPTVTEMKGSGKEEREVVCVSTAVSLLHL